MKATTTHPNQSRDDDNKRVDTQTKEQDEQKINEYKSKSKYKINYKIIIIRLTIIILYSLLCFIQPLILYYLNLQLDSFLGYLGYGFYFLLCLVFNCYGFNKFMQVCLNKTTVGFYTSLQNFFLFQMLHVLILSLYINSETITFLSIYLIFLSFYFGYLCENESYDKSIEVLIQQYQLSLNAYLLHSLTNMSLIYYCLKEMNLQLIITFFLLKIALVMFYHIKYQQSFIIQTVFNIFIDLQLIANKQLIINIRMPQKKILMQIKYMIHLRILEIFYILLNIFLNFIEIKLLSILLILPLINLIYSINYKQQIKIFSNQNIEIFTKQDYENLVQDFESNPIKYQNLRSIYIEGLDFKQAFDCLLYKFRYISVSFGYFYFQGQKWFRKLKRLNKNKDSQEIQGDDWFEYNIEDQIINTDKILPEINEINLRVISVFNNFQFNQIINCRTLIKVKLTNTCLRNIEQPEKVYNNYYNTTMIKIIQAISFKNHISKYLPVNPQQVFIDLDEDHFLIN